MACRQRGTDEQARLERAVRVRARRPASWVHRHAGIYRERADVRQCTAGRLVTAAGPALVDRTRVGRIGKLLAEPGGGRGVPLPRRSATSGSDELRDAFAHLDARWLVPAVAISLLLQVFRAWRWQLELRPLARIPFGTLWVVISVAYMAINLLPVADGRGRAPVAAVAALARVSFSNVVGNLIVEKTIDSAVIVFYILLGLLTTREPARMGAARRHGARRRVRRARRRSSCCSGGRARQFVERRARALAAGALRAPRASASRAALVDGMRVLGRSARSSARCSLVSLLLWFLPILSSWVMIRPSTSTSRSTPR